MSQDAPSQTGRPNLARRLYDWLLHWAHTPYGMPALVLVTFAESSFFPVPPDPLLVALCIAAPGRSLYFAAAATAGSVAGGITGYWIGAGGWHLVQDFFFVYVPGVSPEAFERIQALYDRWDFWAIFLAGLTPIPYKAFTLSAGVFRISFPIFVIASVLSRGLRFFVVAALIYRYGEPISDFVDRHFNRLTVGFGVLIVLGFAAIQFVF